MYLLIYLFILPVFVIAACNGGNSQHFHFDFQSYWTPHFLVCGVRTPPLQCYSVSRPLYLDYFLGLLLGKCWDLFLPAAACFCLFVFCFIFICEQGGTLFLNWFILGLGTRCSFHLLLCPTELPLWLGASRPRVNSAHCPGTILIYSVQFTLGTKGLEYPPSSQRRGSSSIDGS